MDLFICTVKREVTTETGAQKKVSEKSLTDAISFTECEAVMVDYIKDITSGEFCVTAIKPVQCEELIVIEHESPDVENHYFEAKLKTIILDEKSGKEKVTKSKLMVCARDFDEANRAVKEYLKQSMFDCVTFAIKETDIVDFVSCTKV